MSTMEDAQPPRGIRRFLLVILLPLAALALQWLLWEHIQPYAWFLFYPAVFFSSWIDGLRGGLTTTAISIPLVWWFFIPTQSSFALERPATLVAMGFFAIMGTLFAFTHERLRIANRRVAKSLAAAHAATEHLEKQVEARTAELERNVASLSHERDFSDTLINGLPGIFYLYDQELRALRWNRNFEQVLGYSGEDIARMSPLEFFANEDRARLADRIEQVFTQGTSEVTADLVTSIGQRIPYYFTGRRIKVADKSCLLGIGIDISERVRIENKLHESENRYRLLFEANPLPMWVYDLETLRFLAVNDAAVTHYGYSRDEFLAMTIKDIRPEEEIPRLLENIALIDEGFDEAGLWRHLKKGGSLIDVEIRSHTLPFNGRPAEIVLAQDVTERQRGEQERKSLIAELEKRNTELERFTYTVSHDLKSPLITILGFVGQLEQDLANGATTEVKADLKFIVTAANQMRELLDNLLKLSRAGRAIGETQPVVLAHLVKDALAQVGDRLAHAEVRTDIPADLPPLAGDPVRLREVFQNLLENAAKFTPGQDDSLIEIGCTAASEELRCYVRDNGIGIPAEYQEKIFGLFEQLDPEHGGTGIGLAIVRRIVEEHGGRIWVESAGTGQGCTFHLTLPFNS